MALWLKQSTAATIVLGPFVDDTDGKTAETALTISQADVRLSKNGAAFAQANDANAAAHMENGNYSKALNATDTGTLGSLRVSVAESGALPVWADFMVVPANVWDSFFGADVLQVDLLQIGGDAQSATDLKDFADAGYDPATNKVQGVVLTDTVTTYTGNTPQTGDAFARLGAPAGASVSADIAAIEAQTDDIGVAGAGLTAVPWNAAWDAEVQSEVADALAVYDPPTHAELTAEIDAVQTDVAAVQTTADAILVDTGTTLQAELDGIQADTEDIQSRLPAALTAGGNIKADALAISGDTNAADFLEALMDGGVAAQVNGVATTTSIPADGFTEATNDHFNGRLITFTSGALRFQQTAITDYVGATQTFTVAALTEAPADNDFFVIH